MFQKILEKSVARLYKSKGKGDLFSFALIGGFAVARWGNPRGTVDVDFIIKLSDLSLEDLAEKLNGRCVLGSFDDPLLGSITFTESNIPVQLLLFPPAWEEIAFHEMTEDKVDGHLIPFVDWKALVLLKLYVGGAHDLEDARNILKNINPSKFNLEYLEKKATALRVSKRLKRVM